MARAASDALQDIKSTIYNIKRLLDGLSFVDIESDWPTKSALERGIEVISEASRNIPDEMKELYGPTIPWRSIADIGNWIRHSYHKTSLLALWDIYVGDLDPLEAVIDAMIAAIPPSPPRS